MLRQVVVPLLLWAGSSGFADERPNIILIMVDDMGYSDLGCFGSEIETPNIDRLAKTGVTFTQFTNNAKCETTRQSMLTGRYHAEVKNGSDSVTIPENLGLAGYQNFMVGKWHIFDRPEQRGFDRWYGFPNGCVNFFTCHDRGKPSLHKDGEPIPVPDGFYATKDFTDYAMTYVKERDRKKPFFMYVAYNAPHYPLQAPEKDVMKYRGKYKDGWAALRDRRYQGLKKTGMIAEDQPLSKPSQDAWDELSEADKDRQDLLMATYAAMIDIVDRNVGRLVQTLKEEGAYENTLILFLSDNGACPFDRTTPATLENNYMPWDAESFYCYTSSWANACNTPFRLYKQNQHEGGIRTPMIAHWPAGIKNPGRLDRDRGHVMDLHSTFRELAGVEYPTEYKGRKIGPSRGLSLAAAFKQEPRPVHDELFYSFYGKYSALWTPEWKLVNNQELFSIANDRIEASDLAEKNPEKLNAMKARWKALASELGVKDRGSKSRKGGKKNPGAKPAPQPERSAP